MTVSSEIERFANQLPVPVYLVAEDGRFLYANERLRKLLQIPSGDVTNHGISEFYANPADRDRLVEKVHKAGELVKEGVTFKSGPRNIQVQMSCNPMSENGTFLGYLGVLVEVTEESEYHTVFDAHLPAGVYRLDENDNLTQANLGFAKIFGYSLDQVKGKHVTDFYVDPMDAARIKEEILRDKEINREKIVLRRRTGESFAAYVTAVGFFDRHGQYMGRGGIIEDRSLEEQYERLLQDIPVGFYVVKQQDGKDIVVDCNEEFARIFDVASREAMIGRDVREFHYSPVATARLMEKIEQAANSGGTVLGEQFRVCTARGTMKIIEVNARPQVREGHVVGRTGAIRDTTAEMEMRNRITTLTGDIGAVLHTFRHTLTQLKHNMAAVADVLAGSPNTPITPETPEEIEAQVRGPLSELASAVEAFLNAISTAHASPLDANDRESLQKLAGILQAYRSHPKAHWRDLWRGGVVEILAICKRIRANTVARSAYRPLALAAEKIAAITGLATLSIAREAIIAVDAPLDALYELVMSGTRPRERPEVIPIESCVVEAINSLSDFAEERGVDIKFNDTSRTEVSVVRVEITRAIRNLLHNSIKYSWKKEVGRPWVTVAVSINELAMAEVSVQNRGVPVPAEEIEQGLVFRLGFRGRLSSDRGRMGTGVGLADSLRIARDHGGSLRMESRPVSQNANTHHYDQPFVTTTFLALPLVRRSEGR